LNTTWAFWSGRGGLIRIRQVISSGRVRLIGSPRRQKTETAPAPARLAVLLRQAGFPDQARQVPAVDRRTTDRALASV